MKYLKYFNKDSFDDFLKKYDTTDKKLLSVMYTTGLSNIVFENHMRTSHLISICIVGLEAIFAIAYIILFRLNILSDNTIFCGIIPVCSFLILEFLNHYIHNLSWKKTKENIEFLNDNILEKLKR